MHGCLEGFLKKNKTTPLAIRALAADGTLSFDDLWVYVMQWAPQEQGSSLASGFTTDLPGAIAAAVAATQSAGMSASDPRVYDNTSSDEDVARTSLRAACHSVFQDQAKVLHLQHLQQLGAQGKTVELQTALRDEQFDDVRLLVESPIEQFQLAIAGATSTINLDMLNVIRRARITEMERLVLGKPKEPPSASLKSAIRQANTLRLSKLQFAALAGVNCDKSTSSEPLAAFIKCSGDGLAEFTLAKERLTTILFNRLPSQAMQLDQFWKQVSLRVHHEVRHGTPWKALSRWLFLMLEHMESPATSSVATITFSLNIDVTPLALAEAELSHSVRGGLKDNLFLSNCDTWSNVHCHRPKSGKKSIIVRNIE